jgi:hypothetical protein
MDRTWMQDRVCEIQLREKKHCSNLWHESPAYKLVHTLTPTTDSCGRWRHLQLPVDRRGMLCQSNQAPPPCRPPLLARFLRPQQYPIYISYLLSVEESLVFCSQALLYILKVEIPRHGRYRCLSFLNTPFLQLLDKGTRLLAGTPCSANSAGHRKFPMAARSLQ